ncbi:MAG: response regulator, partial [Cellulosimicrobium funkei]
MSRPSPDVVRVVTVDDQPEVRSALRLMLGGEPDIAVVGEAVDGDHARDVIEACRPDVVLMDLRMPRCDGLVATARETALRPETAIIVLTT